MNLKNDPLIAFLRRIIRFIALPYAFIFLVDWKVCTKSYYQVFMDFLYIFFVLKDYPDYYMILRFWEKDRSEWKYYYGSIYNPNQKKKLNKNVQKNEYEILFADKLVCHQLIYGNHKLKIPKLLAQLQICSDYKNSIRILFNNSDLQKAIIKPVRGKGGDNIYLVHKDKNNIYVSDKKINVKLDEFILKHDSIVQQFVVQHPLLEKIAPSLNTIRIETFLSNKKVLLLGAFIRFGLHHPFVDNICTGGISVGIDVNSGILHEYAWDMNATNRYYNHPISGFRFKGIKIPFWEEIIEMSKQIQFHFPYFKLLGPDIGITADGPIIIEINATPDHGGMEKHNQPLFKNYEIWKEFKKNDLLINNLSMNLYSNIH